MREARVVSPQFLTLSLGLCAAACGAEPASDSAGLSSMSAGAMSAGALSGGRAGVYMLAGGATGGMGGEAGQAGSSSAGTPVTEPEQGGRSGEPVLNAGGLSSQSVGGVGGAPMMVEPLESGGGPVGGGGSSENPEPESEDAAAPLSEPSPEGTSDAGSGEVESDCPFSGAVQYRLNGAEAWPADVVERLTAAMDEAIYYYNCYSELSHSLVVNYKEGVPTAEANVDGWMSFGQDRAYMVLATAMHEVAHTMGVGYYPWQELQDNGRWTGEFVNALMASLPAGERDPDTYSQRDYITADTQHFWPYGLNQAAEHQSEWSLINHVRIVQAMAKDKAEYLAR